MWGGEGGRSGDWAERCEEGRCGEWRGGEGRSAEGCVRSEEGGCLARRVGTGTECDAWGQLADLYGTPHGDRRRGDGWTLVGACAGGVPK